MTAIPPVLTLVLAGGRSDALLALGRMRTASALPFGGKYRVIDFTLSNCVHSGLTRVGVLTQYAPQSLQTHIGIGRSEEHTSELQSLRHLVCRLLLEKK